MPYTKKQHRMFEALVHGWNPKGESLEDLKKLGKKKLQDMADEGVKKSSKKKRSS